jgi:hypothetical protein
MPALVAIPFYYILFVVANSFGTVLASRQEILDGVTSIDMVNTFRHLSQHVIQLLIVLDGYDKILNGIPVPNGSGLD